ncbi:MAG: DUF664 domain-containing protein [Planctomycetes bacterium]|nr:DUF664 domain-containing protein [Planctomycetota bacterium]
MYTKDALLDIHERCHRSLQQFIEHCRTLSGEEQSRALNGFGYPTVRLQLHHIIGAEKYWVSVVQGCMDASEDDADAASMDAIETFRRSVAATTRAYLDAASDAELNTPRPMTTWNRPNRVLTPAHVIMRTQVHIYHHLGQVSAMCRTMGPTPPAGLDYPLESVADES